MRNEGKFNFWGEKSFESEARREVRNKEYIKNQARLKQQIEKSIRQIRTKGYFYQERSHGTKSSNTQSEIYYPQQMLEKKKK